MVDRASADLAYRNVDNQENLSSLRPMAGFQWNKAHMGAVGAERLSAVLQGAVVNPRARQLAQSLKLRLRRIWFAPPKLMVEEPHKWWDLIATAGHNGRASNEAWNRLFQ